VHGQKPRDTRSTIARLWAYMKTQKAGLVSTVILVALGSGLDVLGPYLLLRAIDGYLIPGDMPGLARMAGLMVLVQITDAGITWGQTWVMTGVSQRVVATIRAELFAMLGDLPLEFFDRRQHGDIMSRLTNDISSINDVLTGVAQQVVGGVLTTVGTAIMMFYLSPPLALATILSTACLTIGANRWLSKRTRDGFRASQRDLGQLNGYVEEIIAGARLVKACGREDDEIGKFGALNDTLKNSATRAQIYAGFAGPIMNTITNTGTAAVGGFGGILALYGMATVGLIASFLNYARQFGRPLNDIANLYNTMQSALAAAERVFEVIDEPREVDSEPGAEPLQVRGEVEFEDVSFSYIPGQPVLRDVSLHALPGQSIALIGPTGAGKTTIVNLLTRFYEIDGGTIKLDGRDLRTIPKDELRRQVAVVLQDTYLFSGTVRENIRYGRLDATDEEVERAAKYANAHTFIQHMPHGYDTPLAERGGNLSQGQRQLLAIARAVLADPGILILDEATSSVDTRTELQIQEAMRFLMMGRTSFVIAHRLSTIREADQILVITGGEIVEHGTHRELIQSDGFYARAANPNAMAY